MEAHVNRWIKKNRTHTETAQRIMQSQDHSHLLDKSMQEEAIEELQYWHESIWDLLQANDLTVAGLPIEFLIADKELDWLVMVMHVASTYE
jgi:hypothetical protein